MFVQSFWQIITSLPLKKVLSSIGEDRGSGLTDLCFTPPPWMPPPLPAFNQVRTKVKPPPPWKVPPPHRSCHPPWKVPPLPPMEVATPHEKHPPWKLPHPPCMEVAPPMESATPPHCGVWWWWQRSTLAFGAKSLVVAIISKLKKCKVRWNHLKQDTIVGKRWFHKLCFTIVHKTQCLLQMVDQLFSSAQVRTPPLASQFCHTMKNENRNCMKPQNWKFMWRTNFVCWAWVNQQSTGQGICCCAIMYFFLQFLSARHERSSMPSGLVQSP